MNVVFSHKFKESLHSPLTYIEGTYLVGGYDRKYEKVCLGRTTYNLEIGNRSLGVEIKLNFTSSFSFLLLYKY